MIGKSENNEIFHVIQIDRFFYEVFIDARV